MRVRVRVAVLFSAGQYRRSFMSQNMQKGTRTYEIRMNADVYVRAPGVWGFRGGGGGGGGVPSIGR
jgi:hypothetical protein